MGRNSYPTTLVHAVGLGLFSGVFGLVYLFIVEEGIHALWHDWESPEWFSGSLRVVWIPVAAGLLVGLVYRFLRLPARFPGFIAELEAGHVEPKTAPGAVLIALVSLIGGASLGPEAPLGTAGGAAGTWLARRTGGDEEDVRTDTFVGMSGIFGGLVSSPLGGPLLAFELEHEQSNRYYFNQLIPGALAGVVAFAIMWPLIGTPFIELFSVPEVEFAPWMLFAGIGIGVVGSAAALGVGKLMTGIVNLMRALDGRPEVRGVLGGLVVGIIAFTLPLTLFSGTTGLVPILESPASFGVATLLALAGLKTVALGASLGGGFYGGPIFPMFFVGGTLGAAVHVLIPSIPLALAVGAMMAAVGGAMAMIPLSMSLLASLVLGTDFIVFGAILMAGVTAFAIRYSLSGAAAESDARHAAGET